MWSQREGGLSVITQVKVSSPEIINVARGQGFHFLEASTAARINGECVSGVPGSKSVAGNLTVHIGTWESHIVPNRSFQQAEEARRKYGGMVVGLTHIRGVVGVMPGASPPSCFRKKAGGALEGVSSKTQRDEEAYAIR